MIRNLTQTDLSKQEIVIYKAPKGKVSITIKLVDDSLWLSLTQITELFEKDKSVIAKHIRNIFKEAELEKKSTVAKFATVQTEGGHKVERYIDHYNLDAIISVGYRVNSKRGTQFRRWASQVLKDHIIKGYSLNQQQLNTKSINELQQTIDLLSKTMINQDLVTDIGVEMLQIIQEYSKTWDTLRRFDEDKLEDKRTKAARRGIMTYDEANAAITALTKELGAKGAGNLFGKERDNALEAILGNIEQTFDKRPLYPSVQARAANLLYLVIKDHPFSDGNKRIACLLFLMYIKKSGLSLKFMGNNALIALALLIAESDPMQKEIMVRLTIHLLQD